MVPLWIRRSLACARRHVDTRRVPTDAVRVLILEMPALVRDMLVTAIDREPRLELVDEVPAPGTVADAAWSDAVDVILCGTEGDALPPACCEVLRRGAGLRIVAVRVDDGTGTLHRLRPDSTDLGELSPGDVVAALRTPPGEAAP